MAMRNYEYYLFDFDGTLLDTDGIIYPSFEYIFRKYLDHEIDRVEISSQLGMPLSGILRRYFGSLDEGDLAKLVDEYEDYQSTHLADTVSFFPGVSEILQILVASGKKCAIVTSRGKASCADYLKRLGAESLFAVSVTIESTNNHKPHPEPVLYAMSELGVSDASKVIFIGDSEYDIEAGQRAGIDTALALWGRVEPYESSVKPTYYLSSPRLLNNLGHME